MNYLHVHGWERWQSYRADRGQPPWIKLHRCLMRNHEWVSMTDAERGQLIAIWLLAADDGGKIPSDGMLVQRLCYMTTEPDLARFVELGFLEADATVMTPRRQGDANVTPRRRQRDAPEAETETETETEKTPTPTPSPREGALVTTDSNGASLEHRIMAAFMEKSVDKGLTWPPSEREHIARLVERARAEPDPEAWIKRFLETAWRLKREGKGIWRDRPWMPRTFCGPKAITWVIEAMGESPNQATMEDLECLREQVKDHLKRR